MPSMAAVVMHRLVAHFNLGAGALVCGFFLPNVRLFMQAAVVLVLRRLTLGGLVQCVCYVAM